MRILSLKNDAELAAQTEVLLRPLVMQKTLAGELLRGFFPTGRSAERFYQGLREDKGFWRKKFQVLQIDEFASPERLFYNALKTQLLEPLDLLEQQEVIDPAWTDLQMSAHIEKVLQRPVDFALLGLGPNGHVGFHEPRENGEKFFGGRVHLSEQSFARVPGAKTHWALTFGVASFLKAKKIILLVTGTGKEEIYQSFLKSSPTSQIPATLLKQHGDLTVLSTLSEN